MWVLSNLILYYPCMGYVHHVLQAQRELSALGEILFCCPSLVKSASILG